MPKSIDQRQDRAIAFVKASPGVAASDVAARLGITPQSASTLMRRIEQGGFVFSKNAKLSVTGKRCRSVYFPVVEAPATDAGLSAMTKKPTPGTAEERALLIIRKAGFARDHKLASDLGTTARAVRSMLLPYVEQGDLVSCDVYVLGHHQIEYRHSALGTLDGVIRSNWASLGSIGI